MYMLRKTLYMKRIISFMIVLVALITVSVKSFAQQKINLILLLLIQPVKNLMY